jgi:hypothetical protein
MASPKLAGVEESSVKANREGVRVGTAFAWWRLPSLTAPMKTRTNTSRSPRYDRNTRTFYRSRAMKSQ